MIGVHSYNFTIRRERVEDDEVFYVTMFYGEKEFYSTTVVGLDRLTRLLEQCEQIHTRTAGIF